MLWCCSPHSASSSAWFDVSQSREGHFTHISRFKGQKFIRCTFSKLRIFLFNVTSKLWQWLFCNMPSLVRGQIHLISLQSYRKAAAAAAFIHTERVPDPVQFFWLWFNIMEVLVEVNVESGQMCFHHFHSMASFNMSGEELLTFSSSHFLSLNWTTFRNPSSLLSMLRVCESSSRSDWGWGHSVWWTQQQGMQNPLNVLKHCCKAWFGIWVVL